MLDLKTLRKYKKRDFRHAYIAGRVHTSIAMQIRLLREKLGFTQRAFAEKLGKKQTTISRLENLSYGRVTVNTLLEITEALDMALVVRIVSFDEFLRQHGSVKPQDLSAETFEQTVFRHEAAEQIQNLSSGYEAREPTAQGRVSYIAGYERDHPHVVANVGQPSSGSALLKAMQEKDPVRRNISERVFAS